MVAAALGILAIVALSVGGGGGDDDLDDARLAAGRFGERFLTFEHDGLDEWKSGVLSLSTGGFSKEVDEVEEGLRRLIGEAELDATTQVTEIFMGEIDRGTVSAVLLYDRDLRSASGTRSESDRYLQLTLLQVDGEWLVDNVIDIATADALGAGARNDDDHACDAEPTTRRTPARLICSQMWNRAESPARFPPPATHGRTDVSMIRRDRRTRLESHG